MLAPSALSSRTAAPLAARRACRASVQGRSRVITQAAIKLYANPRTRSKIVEWYLKELGVEYTTKDIDMAAGDHKTDEFAAVNPFKKLPALEDGDLKMFESGAMLQYLADKYGPANTPEKRAEVAKWVLFANSTLGNALFLEQFRETQLPACMQPLEDILSKQDYLLGDELTAADVAVGAYLLYVPIMLTGISLDAYPACIKYMERLQARPACMIKPPPTA